MPDKRDEPLVSLLNEVLMLRAEVAAGGAALYRTWRGRFDRPAFRDCALNFAHYLVLRRFDLRSLQRKLMALGLSSLGRSESRVMPSLDAVAWSLGQLTGTDELRPPSEARFFRGERKLRANTIEFFGPEQNGRMGRIMVTLGSEAAEDPDYIADLARQGADVLRINCGHDDASVWLRIIENARAVAHVRPLRVLMEIAGPKIRMKEVCCLPGAPRLKIGDVLLLTGRIDPLLSEYPFQTTLTHDGILPRLKVGDIVSIDDGKLRGAVFAQVEHGFTVNLTEGRSKGVKLRPGRGLNFPAVDLNIDPLTEKDRADLAFAAQHADLIGFSFLQNAEQVVGLQTELAALRPDWQSLGMMIKIETPAAVSNLPEIIVQAAGRQPLAVMIARGDLAVEIGFERVAEMQEEILWLCEAAQVPAIWATQVLDGLIHEGLPSRSEMTDAAMAVQAECVMLNKGPHLKAGVAALDRVLRRMAENRVKKTPTLRALRSWPART
jgi:pyruvate kinase